MSLLLSSEMKISRRRKFPPCCCPFHCHHVLEMQLWGLQLVWEEAEGCCAAADARCACPGKHQPSLVFALVFGCSCFFLLAE